MSASTGRDTVSGVGLAFVAGFVDAAAFIALTGLFTAHVTGNFVLIGAELITTSPGVLAKLLALPVFVLAVAVTRLLAVLLERRRARPYRILLTFEAAFLAAFAGLGTMLSPLGSPDGIAAVSVGMLAVAAMGIQNCVGRLLLAHVAATTVMTVNVTQAVIDLTDRIRGAGAAPGAGARLGRTFLVVLAFAAGALAGAYGVATLSFACMLLPTLVLLGLALAPAEPARA